MKAFVVVHTVRTRHFLQLFWCACQAHKARMKLSQITIDLGWSVPLGVHADEHWRYNGTDFGIQHLDCLRLFLHFLRTNIWTVRESEVQQEVLTLVVLVRPCDTLPVNQLERTAKLWRSYVFGGDNGSLFRLLPSFEIVVVSQTNSCKKCSEHGRPPGELDVVKAWLELGRCLPGNGTRFASASFRTSLGPCCCTSSPLFLRLA
mmetsp:Transcript_59057/g.157154  ORF Transcript_59057/g.157154 Transcript_59057/m.157154 type:complete len:204 (+) Transcript_59057:346-957(+)